MKFFPFLLKRSAFPGPLTAGRDVNLVLDNYSSNFAPHSFLLLRSLVCLTAPLQSGNCYTIYPNYKYAKYYQDTIKSRVTLVSNDGSDVDQMGPLSKN